MALIGVGQPRFEQPQEFTRLSDRFAVPEAFVYVPSIGTVYGGDRPTFSSGAITRTPAQGMSAVQTATNSVGVTTNKLRRISPGAATFVFVGARRASTVGFLSGVLDTGTSYIDQVGINMNSSEATSAGNVMLGYRDTAGVIRQRATTSAPLVLNKMHGVVLRIDDDLSYRCWVDGVEHSMTGSTNSPGASAGFMQYDYALLNRSNRGSLGAVSITNYDLALFARFASNFISDPAGLSRNPWQLFEDRRIGVPVTAAGGGTTVSVPSASLTLAGYAPSVVAPQVVSVPAAALTLSAYAPVVSTPVVVGVPSATITLTGFAPVVVNPRTISVPAASLTLTGYAPDVSTGGAGTTIAIPAGALTLSAFAPTVATTAVIAIPSGSLTLTAYAPTVSDGTGVPTIVSVSLGTLTLTGFAPRVSDGSAPLGQKLDEYPRLPSDPYQISQKVTSLFSLTNTRVNELSTGALWANYNASAAKPASTEGAWGDQRKNSRPVELGSPGSKYVVIGWVRLETDWADCRVITGN